MFERGFEGISRGFLLYVLSFSLTTILSICQDILQSSACPPPSLWNIPSGSVISPHLAWTGGLDA
jgi:hypothetical protein